MFITFQCICTLNGTSDVFCCMQHVHVHLCVFATSEIWSLPVSSADRPDPPMDLDLSDPAARSVRLTWIPGNDHRSPITGQCTHTPRLLENKNVQKVQLSLTSQCPSVEVRGILWAHHVSEEELKVNLSQITKLGEEIMM